jgi:multicomponent Na+:H+ antiporter subunit C
MTAISSVLIAVLFSCGIYLMLSRNLQRLIIGTIVLSNGVNLMVLTVAGLPENAVPPLIGTAEAATGTLSDPLPQAFILTAIVIGLALTAFLLAMALRYYHGQRQDELEVQP